ncbi:unnamed protein product, partial [Mesorhabditis spiculigera]
MPRFLVLLLAIISTLSAELLFAQVWFRHGARAPTIYMRFPSEPDDYGSMFPYEKGELTNDGKMMEYHLGKKLRQEFAGFAPESYLPHENMVYFDEDNRTSDSAALVMAGFYPPTDKQIWNPELIWNPVALHQADILVKPGMGLANSCPKIGAVAKERPEFWNLLNYDQPLRIMLQKASGVNIYTPKTMSDVMDEYRTRARLQDPRLPVEPWVDDAMVARIKSVQENMTLAFFAFPEVSQSIGDILQVPEMRFFCDYGASFIVELHKIGKDLVLKFFFSDSYGVPRWEVTVPKCGKTCLLSNFRAVFGKETVNDVQFWSQCKEIPGEESGSVALIFALIAVIIALLLTNVFSCMKMNRIQSRRNTLDNERSPLLL